MNQCISIKSKNEPTIRCPCQIKKNPNNIQLCGKHLRMKCPIIFKNKANKIDHIYTLEKLPDCLNCNIINLYDTLNYHKIKYDKNDKIINLYNKLKNRLEDIDNYKNNISKIITIQKNIRKFLIYRYKKLSNTEDFYTLDNVYLTPLKFIHIIKDSNNVSYFFDLRSLYKYLELSHNILNPYKNIPFTEGEMKAIKIRLNSFDKGELIIKEDNLTPEQYYKQYLIDIFQKFDNLGYITNIEWYLKLTFNQIKDLYIKCEDIWNYRASLTTLQKKNIVHDGKLFQISPKRVKRLTTNYEIELRKLILNEFNKAITQGVTEADKNHGAILMLTGFADVSDDVRTSFPWLSQNI